MYQDLLPGEDILDLQKQSGRLCITIVIPTHRLSPERRADRVVLEKAIRQTEEQLKTSFEFNPDTPILIEKLHESVSEIDMLHQQEGLGIYVSSAVQKMISFPFPVVEKIKTGTEFDLRELFYKAQLAAPYYVLLLSEQEARFYEGQLEHLTEIKDRELTEPFEEEYIYSPPSRSSSYAGQAHLKNFEKDKSFMEAIRLKNIFRTIDHQIQKYAINHTPLILAAPEKEIGLYKQKHLSSYSPVLELKGNYLHTKHHDLEAIVWPLIYQYSQEFFKKKLSALEELIGHHRAVLGLESCWRSATEGNAYELLLEKDYSCPGYVTESDQHLHFKKPRGKHHYYPDIVEVLIEKVRLKNGKILFGANDTLINYGRIALITRY